MTRIILAALVALALGSAAPTFACPDCESCPMHKDKVAAADKAEKKEPEKRCDCGATSAKDCKCGGKCHCWEKKDKPEGKKT